MKDVELKEIDRGRPFDFGKTSAQYAACRDIYPAELYERLRGLGVAAESSRLIKELNPAWGSGAYALQDMGDALFPGMPSDSFYTDVPFTRERWHGRMLACRGTLASMDESTLNEWQKRHIGFMSACPERFTARHKIDYIWFRL